MIDFEHVSKQYKGGNMALKDINLHIGAGEFVFVLGHSGAGKSTMLKMILRTTWRGCAAGRCLICAVRWGSYSRIFASSPA
jgi:ABC-type ATPase involved in cell division